MDKSFFDFLTDPPKGEPYSQGNNLDSYAEVLKYAEGQHALLGRILTELQAQRQDHNAWPVFENQFYQASNTDTSFTWAPFTSSLWVCEGIYLVSPATHFTMTLGDVTFAIAPGQITNLKFPVRGIQRSLNFPASNYANPFQVLLWGHKYTTWELEAQQGVLQHGR